MEDFIKSVGAITPVLTAIFGVGLIGSIMSIFTSLSYDSFDEKLLSRDKHAVIKLKKFIGVVLIIVPIFCALAFLLAYEALLLTGFIWVILFLLALIILCIIVVRVILFIDSYYIKKANNNSNATRGRFGGWIEKVSKGYKEKVEIKIYNSVTFMLCALTIIAYLYISDYTNIFKSLIECLLVMCAVAILVIFSLLAEKKTINYTFIGEDKDLDNLKIHIEEDKELLLEYFLSDSIAILATKDKKYKVIKRVSDSTSLFEMYKENSIQ